MVYSKNPSKDCNWMSFIFLIQLYFCLSAGNATMSPRRKTKYRSSQLKSERQISKEIIIRHLQILLCRLQVYCQFTTVPQKINIYVNDNYKIQYLFRVVTLHLRQKYFSCIFFYENSIYQLPPPKRYTSNNPHWTTTTNIIETGAKPHSTTVISFNSKFATKAKRL